MDQKQLAHCSVNSVGNPRGVGEWLGNLFIMSPGSWNIGIRPDTRVACASMVIEEKEQRNRLVVKSDNQNPIPSSNGETVVTNSLPNMSELSTG